MTPAQRQAVNELRDAGCVVIIWEPTELEGLNGDTRYFESRVIELGNEAIIDIQES